jgi:hypothetical protein
MRITLPPEKLKVILIMAAVLIALALPLMFLLEDFVRDAIILPLGYYAWYFGVIFDALPQSLLIGVLVALLAYLAAGSLRRQRSAPDKPRTHQRQLPGNVRIWTDRIDLVSQGTYSRARFEHQFGQLLLRLISHEERLSLRETMQRIQAGEIEIAPELKPYVLRALSTGPATRRGLLGWLKALLTRKPSKEATLRTVALEIEPALRWVERQLRLVQGEELDE